MQFMHINLAVARSSSSAAETLRYMQREFDVDSLSFPAEDWRPYLFCAIYRGMSIYMINPIGGGSGFKVNVSDGGGGVRVVGIFSSETAAAAWITVDRGTAERKKADTASNNSSQRG
jgi:hypothetical protein